MYLIVGSLHGRCIMPESGCNGANTVCKDGICLCITEYQESNGECIKTGNYRGGHANFKTCLKWPGYTI